MPIKSHAPPYQEERLQQVLHLKAAGRRAMRRQRKSCRKGCSQVVLSTSGLSSGLSMTTVCSPAHDKPRSTADTEQHPCS